MENRYRKDKKIEFITDEHYEIAKKNGIKRWTVYCRVNVYGWTVQEAITRKTMKKSECHKKYPDWVHKALKQNGISHITFYARLNRGWTIEHACTIPPGKIAKYSKLNIK